VAAIRNAPVEKSDNPRIIPFLYPNRFIKYPAGSAISKIGSIDRKLDHSRLGFRHMQHILEMLVQSIQHTMSDAQRRKGWL